MHRPWPAGSPIMGVLVRQPDDWTPCLDALLHAFRCTWLVPALGPALARSLYVTVKDRCPPSWVSPKSLSLMRACRPASPGTDGSTCVLGYTHEHVAVLARGPSQTLSRYMWIIRPFHYSLKHSSRARTRARAPCACRTRSARHGNLGPCGARLGFWIRVLLHTYM